MAIFSDLSLILLLLFHPCQLSQKPDFYVQTEARNHRNRLTFRGIKGKKCKYDYPDRWLSNDMLVMPADVLKTILLHGILWLAQDDGNYVEIVGPRLPGWSHPKPKPSDVRLNTWSPLLLLEYFLVQFCFIIIRNNWAVTGLSVKKPFFFEKRLYTLFPSIISVFSVKFIISYSELPSIVYT